uniref:Uncharacterized protein n=1 Tax=Trichuris muris TaxID=70415 RepID=A0A5S6QRL9_TRIMR
MSNVPQHQGKGNSVALRISYATCYKANDMQPLDETGIWVQKFVKFHWFSSAVQTARTIYQSTMLLNMSGALEYLGSTKDPINCVRTLIFLQHKTCWQSSVPFRAFNDQQLQTACSASWALYDIRA